MCVCDDAQVFSCYTKINEEEQDLAGFILTFFVSAQRVNCFRKCLRMNVFLY